MSETKTADQKAIPTLEDVWRSIEEKYTVAQIVDQLNSCATEQLHIEVTKAAAKEIHGELLTRLEATSDPDARLAVARAAKSHFYQIAAENSHLYLIDQIENHWDRWRALRHYQQNPANRPADSKYSLEEISEFEDSGPTYIPEAKVAK
jgi:hypothetical protein